MYVMSFAVEVEFGILVSIPSIALAHSNRVLSFILTMRKILEYLSQNIRKNLKRVSVKTLNGSGFGTVSTCISSKKDLGVEVRVLDLAACGILVILHDVQNLSTLGMISTSSHNPSKFFFQEHLLFSGILSE